MTDPTPILEQHLAACAADPLAVLVSNRIDEALGDSDFPTVCRTALRLCLAHPGPIPDARLILSYAATVATEPELIALASKLWHAHYPNDPDVFFHVPNVARLLSRVCLDALLQSLPDGNNANLAMAFGCGAVLAAKRQGRELPDAVLPLLRTGLRQVNRLDETLLCEMLDGPWSRVWPIVAERPWLFRIGEPEVAMEQLSAYETMTLAIAMDLGQVLVNRWRSATENAERVRYAAALAWGFPLSVAPEVLTTLAERSWRERQSLLHALIRHGDALLPTLDAALIEERTRAIAFQVWLELPPTEAVLARTPQMEQVDPAETEVRRKTEAHAPVREAKYERTLDPRPLAWQMMLRYLRSGRNLTESVLAPAHTALAAGDRSAVIAAWLLFESLCVTDASSPIPFGLGEPWRPFVQETTTDLRGIIHLARALLSLPDRESVECEGASAIAWAGETVDDLLVWLIHRDPPPWAIQ